MINYQYNYALVDRASKMCMEVRTSSHDQVGGDNDEWIFVQIESYNEEYLFKYYNEADGKFYWDDAFTQEFIPA